MPWPLRVLTLAFAVGLGAAAAWLGWQYRTRHDAGDLAGARAEQAALAAQLNDLQEQLAAAQSDRARLSQIANTADSQVKVEQTATERLAGQLRALEAENGKLKADLAYLESLLPAPEMAGEGAIVIRRLMVEAGDAPNQLHYRALLAQPGRAERAFAGSFQFVVTTQAAGGRSGTFTWPAGDGGDARERVRLSFTRFQRVEGSFEVPAGVTIRSVQLRVLERGNVRAQQSVAF